MYRKVHLFAENFINLMQTLFTYVTAPSLSVVS